MYPSLVEIRSVTLEIRCRKKKKERRKKEETNSGIIWALYRDAVWANYNLSNKVCGDDTTNNMVKVIFMLKWPLLLLHIMTKYTNILLRKVRKEQSNHRTSFMSFTSITTVFFNRVLLTELQQSNQNLASSFSDGGSFSRFEKSRLISFLYRISFKFR